MTTNTDPVRAHKPCGGCGNADPDKVCFGCRHDFGEALASAPPSAPVGVEWPAGVLSRERTLKVLREHNAWRRGARGPQTDARLLGLALDAAIAALAAQQPAAPSGEAVGAWVTVPRKLTRAMANAAWRDIESQGIDPEDVETPQIWDAMLAAAPQQPVGVDEAPTWSRQQPTVPGIYGIRGFNLCRPASEQFEAVVVVREHGGELVCNLHESTSEDDLESWAPICDLDPDFEWRVFVPGWEQQGGRDRG